MRDESFQVENVRLGSSWLVLGLLTVAGCFIYNSRDALLLIVLANLAFSVLIVGFVTRSATKVLGQLCCGVVLLIAVSAVAVDRSIEPMALVPIWFGVVAGCANAYTASRLGLIALLGQLVPIGLVALTVVTRHDLPVITGVVCFTIAAATCIFGSLVARLYAHVNVTKKRSESVTSL